jgi:hypothetical protein
VAKKPPIEIGPPFFFRNVPANLHAKFKAYCARRGKTMRAMIIEMVRQAVKEDVVYENRNTAPAIKGSNKKAG